MSEPRPPVFKPTIAPEPSSVPTKITQPSTRVSAISPHKNSNSLHARYHFSQDIPKSYGHVVCRAIPRDAEWLFTYWELPAEYLEKTRIRIGSAIFDDATRYLRVFNVTNHAGKGCSYFDIEITPWACDWYVKVPLPGCSYLVDVGMKCRDGSFHSLVRSNTAAIGRNNQSEIFDSEWRAPEEVPAVPYRENAMLGSSEHMHLQNGGSSPDMNNSMPFGAFSELFSGSS